MTETGISGPAAGGDRQGHQRQPAAGQRPARWQVYGGVGALILGVALAVGAAIGPLGGLLVGVLVMTVLGVAGWPPRALPERSGAAAAPGRTPASPTPVPAPEDPQADRDFGKLARVLFEELPDAVLVVDDAGRLTVANKAARVLFVGQSYERKLFSVVMRRPAVLEAVQRARQSGKAETAEFSDLVPVERHFSAFVTPIHGRPEGGEAGAPVILIVVRDLTALRAVEQMRADFVANASHELRTPLSSLAGFIETLRGHARDDAEARERFLEIMQEQAARMRRLIDDLLSLSRIELNEHVPPAGTVDLKAVAHDVVDALQPLAREARVTLRLVIDRGLQRVTGERDEILQVLQNLVDNAVKYGRPETEVVVRVGPGAPADTFTVVGPCAYVAVTDQGEGIAREHLPRLTERFYRVDVTQSRERGGTGLGLAIVKHILSRHRGKLHVKSDVGVGSTFTVILPAGDKGPDIAGPEIVGSAPEENPVPPPSPSGPSVTPPEAVNKSS